MRFSEERLAFHARREHLFSAVGRVMYPVLSQPPTRPPKSLVLI